MPTTFDERKKLVSELEERLNHLNQKLDEAELKAHLARADAETRAKEMRKELKEKSERVSRELQQARDELKEKAEIKMKLNWKQFQSDVRETISDIENKYADLKEMVMKKAS